MITREDFTQPTSDARLTFEDIRKAVAAMPSMGEAMSEALDRLELSLADTLSSMRLERPVPFETAALLIRAKVYAETCQAHREECLEAIRLDRRRKRARQPVVAREPKRFKGNKRVRGGQNRYRVRVW